MQTRLIPLLLLLWACSTQAHLKENYPSITQQATLDAVQENPTIHTFYPLGYLLFSFLLLAALGILATVLGYFFKRLRNNRPIDSYGETIQLRDFNRDTNSFTSKII